ncbi:MAG: dual specificity protein phosphatase family protein [Halobacteriales archaeon]|nr:dual specificity protein phosphatase family protein [Halobacteriales archaeon]
MEEVHENLFVGADDSCVKGGNGDWAVVHACKHPCHQRAVGGQVSQSHPNYLVLEDGDDLYLNIVDMNQKQKHEFMEPMVSATLEFVDEFREGKQVLIHCNQGQSRSPALAMLYLAKRTDELPDDSYPVAANEFRNLYPRFSPGQGIHLYLQDHWNHLD